MKSVRCLSLIIIALLVCTYARFYMTASSSFQILQTKLIGCTPELLSEKQPVVLIDRVVDHTDLLKTAFKYQFLTSDPKQDTLPGARYVTTARFTLLFSAVQDTHVDLAHPKTQHNLVRIKLPAGMTLVVPPRWTFCPGAAVSCIKLYDSFHAMLRNFTKQAPPATLPQQPAQLRG